MRCVHRRLDSHVASMDPRVREDDENGGSLGLVILAEAGIYT
jgi:hypothetical protein